jgi:hypothetical protein
MVPSDLALVLALALFVAGFVAGRVMAPAPVARAAPPRP